MELPATTLAQSLKICDTRVVILGDLGGPIRCDEGYTVLVYYLLSHLRVQCWACSSVAETMADWPLTIHIKASQIGLNLYIVNRQAYTNICIYGVMVRLRKDEGDRCMCGVII